MVCAIAPAVRRPTRTFSVSVALAPGFRAREGPAGGAAARWWSAVPLGPRLLMGDTPRVEALGDGHVAGGAGARVRDGQLVDRDAAGRRQVRRVQVDVQGLDRRGGGGRRPAAPGRRPASMSAGDIRRRERVEVAVHERLRVLRRQHAGAQEQLVLGGGLAGELGGAQDGRGHGPPRGRSRFAAAPAARTMALPVPISSSVTLSGWTVPPPVDLQVHLGAGRAGDHDGRGGVDARVVAGDRARRAATGPARPSRACAAC